MSDEIDRSAVQAAIATAIRAAVIIEAQGTTAAPHPDAITHTRTFLTKLVELAAQYQHEVPLARVGKDVVSPATVATTEIVAAVKVVLGRVSKGETPPADAAEEVRSVMARFGVAVTSDTVLKAASEVEGHRVRGLSRQWIRGNKGAEQAAAVLVGRLGFPGKSRHFAARRALAQIGAPSGPRAKSSGRPPTLGTGEAELEALALGASPGRSALLTYALRCAGIPDDQAKRATVAAVRALVRE